MRTLGVGTDNDLDNTIVDGIESVRQRITQRVRFWRGTWFLDEADGVPYLREVLDRPTEIGVAGTVIAEQIRGVSDVTSVSQVSTEFDPDTRRLTFRGHVETVYGELDVTEEVG